MVVRTRWGVSCGGVVAVAGCVGVSADSTIVDAFFVYCAFLRVTVSLVSLGVFDEQLIGKNDEGRAQWTGIIGTGTVYY